MAHTVIDPWRPVDPLGEALRVLRLSGAFYCRSELTAPWALSLPSFDRSMMFHIVISGSCRIEIDGAPAQVLRPGQLALVTHGQGHRLIGDDDAVPLDLFAAPRQLLSDRYEVLRHGGGGSATTMLCGLVRCEHPAADQMRRLLPEVIRIELEDAARADWVASTLRLVSTEAVALGPGADEMIKRLADLLVLEVVRTWIVSGADSTGGWFAALRDKNMGHALALIQRDPSRRWTVGSLARACGMSRSAFAARFTALVGVPVKQYVTRWKMQEATLLLEQDRTSLAELADRLGYSNEAAFSRAYKRVTGTSPGALKRDPARASEGDWTIGDDRWTRGDGVALSPRS